ncbi:MAG: replication-relaxation family protein [Candidatus Bathyarchaeia archaeon]
MDYLDERDFEILVALVEHKVLSTFQIAALFFSSLRRAQYSIQQLKDLGLLRTFSWKAAGYNARSSDRHFLSERGVAVAAKYLNRPRRELPDTPRTDGDARASMPHRSGVNAFFCSLVDACFNVQGYGLATWQPERREQGQHRAIQADSFARLVHPGGTVEFHFEYDRNTENHQALVSKFVGYLEYGEFEATFRRLHPNVLFLVPSEGRERNLERALVDAVASERTEAPSAPPPCYSTNLDLIRSAGHLGPIWREILGGKERIRFDQLAVSQDRYYTLEECLGHRWRAREREV